MVYSKVGDTLFGVTEILELLTSGLSVFWCFPNDPDTLRPAAHLQILFQSWSVFDFFFIFSKKLSGEAKSGLLTRTLTLLLSVVGIYPQFRALRSVLGPVFPSSSGMKYKCYLYLVKFDQFCLISSKMYKFFPTPRYCKLEVTSPLARTLGMGYGWLAGDWLEDHQTTKMVQMIEPVSEGVMQFFCQTIILYMIAGPADSKNSEMMIDLSSLAFDESLSSKVLYLSLLSSSLITVCSSLARVDNCQK